MKEHFKNKSIAQKQLEMLKCYKNSYFNIIAVIHC